MESERQIVIAMLELLKVFGIDQRTVASRLGITKSLVSQWKNGVRPIAIHQLDALGQIINEAHEQDLRRDEDATPHLKTPKELERFNLHKLARDEAFKAFQLSKYRWLDHVAPGSSVERLSEQVESLWQTISGYMSRGVRSWELGARIAVTVTAGDLYRTLQLLNIMTPLTITTRAHDEGAEPKGHT
jgi:transcriptional regulator with XRE-family HTH domain